MVVGVIPHLLRAAQAAGDTRWPPGAPLAWAGRLGGVGLFTAGLALFAWTVRLFIQVGRGTLAPWDPTRALVAAGPYRWSRNPMISGVVLMLAGQALYAGSWKLGLYAAAVFAVNHIYFILSEEPALERRFGQPYRDYKARVPRWLRLGRVEDR